MTESGKKPGTLAVILIWLGSGVVFSAPVLWLSGGSANALGAILNALLAWGGPLWMLLPQRGSGLLVHGLVAAVVAAPAVGGGVWLAWRWRGLSPRVRVLVLLAISAAWHLPTALFLAAISSRCC